MDRKTRWDFCFYVLLQLFLPLCIALGYGAGLPFSLNCPVLLLPVLIAGTMALTQRLSKAKETNRFLLLFPISLLNALALLTQGALGGIASLLCLSCGWAMLRQCPKGFWRSISRVLAFLLTVLLLLILPLWGFTQVMHVRRVVQRLDSPEGRYTAIVTSVDQGALGGDTLVEVRDNRKTVNILLGRFLSSREVFRGGWGDWEGMELIWTGEGVLSINGTECSVESDSITHLNTIANMLEVSISGGQLLEYRDSHDSFHGDGSTFARIRGRCRFREPTLWHPLPAPGAIEKAIAMCRDTAGQPGIPNVVNGCWYIWNRHSGSADAHGGTTLHSHGSWNFILAV